MGKIIYQEQEIINITKIKREIKFNSDCQYGWLRWKKVE